MVQLLPVTVELHTAVARVYLNIAIWHEEEGDIPKAYEYFRGAFNTSKELFGIDHPKTARHIDTLREPTYRSMAARTGNPVP